MRWFPLARAEARTLLTSTGVWLLAAILPLWTYRPSYTAWNALEADVTAGYLQYAATLVVPLAIVLLCYRAIVGERESGSIRLLAGLPLTRRDLFAGKVVGRTIGVAAPVLVGLGIVTVAGLLRHGFVSPLRYLAVLGVTVLYVVALVAVVVSVSALVARSITAAGVLVIGLVGLELLWDAVARGIATRLGEAGLLAPESVEGAFFLLVRLSPSGAYNVVTNWLLGVGNSADLHDSVIRDRQPGASTSANVVENSFAPGDAPVYLHEAGGLVVLLCWAIVPLLVGAVAFARGDLT